MLLLITINVSKEAWLVIYCPKYRFLAVSRVDMTLAPISMHAIAPPKTVKVSFLLLHL